MNNPIELVWVNPADIIIDTNVRTVVDIDPAFFESIRDHGVQTPPSCWRDEDGKIHVERGQRRVIASTMAKHPEIPVLVMPREQLEEQAAMERARITAQLVENDQRAELSTGDRVEAFQQLALFGMSADEIAKATKTKRDTVRSAVKIAKESPATVELIKERQLTIDEALVMQEFEEEAVEVLDALALTLRESPRDVPQLVGKLRVQRARACEREKAIAEAERLGVKWVEPEKIKVWDGTHRHLRDARLKGKKSAPSVDEAKAQGGLIATLHEDSVWNGSTYDRSYELRFYIEHPDKHGYEGAPDKVEKSAEQIERERAERAEKKALKAAWIEATELRHVWIKTLIHSFKLPTGAEQWIVRTYVGDGHTYGYVSAGSMNKQCKLLVSWLDAHSDVNESNYNPETVLIVKTIREASPRKAVMYGLGMALAAAEMTLSDPKHPAFADQVGAARYLMQLADWGHHIHQAEQRLIDQHREREETTRGE